MWTRWFRGIHFRLSCFPCGRTATSCCVAPRAQNTAWATTPDALALVPPEEHPQLHYSDWNTPLLADLGLDNAPFVAVCTGASWPTKQWPVAHWRELCRRIEDKGLRVVQLGREDERIGLGVNLVGQTGIRDAACVLRAAKVLICCDSGLMHLALAAGTPVIALFGPTDPSILVRDNPKLIAMLSERECQGCWNRADGPDHAGTCPRGKSSCLADITADSVWQRVRELLGTQP